MFCISGELKFYQGSKGEWIGISHWQDMGNMPHCPYHLQFGFQGQDIGNLPPCPYRLAIQGFHRLNVRNLPPCPCRLATEGLPKSARIAC